MTSGKRMPRRTLRALRESLRGALALVAVAALAGCVGIPTNGTVTEGGAISDTDDSSFAVLASGPQNGASPEEILTDFMQAAKSPEGNYAIARQYLTKDAAEAWKPNAGVVIREGEGTQLTRGETSIDYAVSTRASVNGLGLYTEERTPGSLRLPFTFQKEGDQWRISSLKDVTVLSSDNFMTVFEAHALYFFDPTYRYLVPDIRWFPARSNVATRIVSALLGGQATWLQGGATLTAFPQGTRLATAPVDPKSGLAIVDLTDEVSKTNNLERARMQQQLVTSLGTVSVNTVTMTAAGLPLPVSDPAVSKATSTATLLEPDPLVRQDNKFGFANTDGITSLGALSTKVLSVDARAVALARGQTAAAVLGKAGAYLVTADSAAPVLVDKRSNLVAPSIDTSRFVWSVPSTKGAAVRATGPDGVPHTISSNLPADSRVVSLEVSRDGARVLIYLKTDAGPRLKVAAIIRRDDVPAGLGELVDLPMSPETPIDATWVDDRTIAAVARSGDTDIVTAFPLGGPAESLGRTDGVVTIVGGSGANPNGTYQLRVLTSTGTIRQWRESGWQSTRIVADLLAVQQ